MTHKLKNYILILSAIFAVTFVSFAEEKEEHEVIEGHVIICVFDRMAEFPGGTRSLNPWLRDFTRYPLGAVRSGIEGEVIVQFVVDETGKVGNVEVVSGLSTILDREAIRVVK